EDIIVELSLFGTPGQERFNFMWDVLSQGMDGYVVLVDLSRPESFAEAFGIIAHFRAISDVPFVVGANKGAADGSDLAGLADRIGSGDAPIIPCNATDQESARDLLLALLEAVLDAEEEA